MAVLKIEKGMVEKTMQIANVSKNNSSVDFFTFHYIIVYEEIEKEDYYSKKNIIEKRYFILKVNSKEKSLFDKVKELKEKDKIFNVECGANGLKNVPQKESMFADYYIKSFETEKKEEEKIDDTIPF